MAKNKYKVTIENWSKHQQKLKAGHSHFMFSKRFFDDESIADLKQNECLLYVNLLCIAADLMTNSFVIHSKLMPNLLRIGDKSLHNCLARLQSFQLLTYEKMASNIKEYNIKEDNIIEKKLPTRQKNDEKEKLENKKIKDAYFNAYRLRYGVEPVSNAIFNSQVSSLRKKLGVDDSIGVVEFYLKHNDSFYLKNTHSFGLCLSNAETLRTQMLRGKPITSTMVKSFEKEIEKQDYTNKINNLWKEDDVNK
jgi:hypothetical protein